MEIVEDFDEESFHNNDKTLEIVEDLASFFIFLHVSSCFLIFLHVSSFFIFFF